MIQSNIKLKGEPSAQALASGLATLGRYGDNYMVHAAEGETFVPKEILDANPDLKNQLFSQMKSMGITEPNRYVVGDALNSINPVTGQPEFFFKKIWKAVKKVFKKVLPVAAPILGNIIAPGIGGLIASGLVTKMQGGSWGDALKSAGLSYVGGAAMRGIQGGIGTLGNPNASFFGSFGEGFKGGLTDPFKAAGNLFSTSGGKNPLSQGIFGGNYSAGKEGIMDFIAPKYNPAGTGTEALGSFNTTSGRDSAAIRTDPTVTTSGEGMMNVPDRGFGFGEPKLENSVRTSLDADMNSLRNINAPTSNIAGTRIPTQELLDLQNSFSTPGPALPDKVPGAELSSFLKDQGVDYASGTAGNIQYDSFPKYIPNEEIASQAVAGGSSQGYLSTDPELVAKMAAVKPESSFFSLDNLKEKALSKEVLGPVLAAGVPAALTYALTPSQKKADDDDKKLMNNKQRTAYEQYLAGTANDPNFINTPEGQRLRAEAGLSPVRSREQMRLSSGLPQASVDSWYDRTYGRQPLSGIQMAAVNGQASPIQLGGGMPPGLMAAAGGEITGPGSGTSDSIPAMLSDGEFVMTAQAVRNAGNGNRDLGAARMYDMMSKFERAV